MRHSFLNLKFRPKVVIFLLFILVFSLLGTRHLAWKDMEDMQEQDLWVNEIGEPTENLDLSSKYDALETFMADLSQDLDQPNILKQDILRGWYLGNENEKKYGTPNTWIFQENGAQSRWISPNALDEAKVILENELCRDTAGQFKASCLDTAEDQCEYVGASYCECPQDTQWHGQQGCLLINEDGSFVALNAQELEQGYYWGLPNEKKFNTPENWLWTENGPQSAWHLPGIVINP